MVTADIGIDWPEGTPFPLTPELERIHRPVLVIVGEKDFLGVGGSVIISRRVTGAQLEIVPAATRSSARTPPASRGWCSPFSPGNRFVPACSG